MFYSLFIVNRDITGRNTRQSNLLRVPKGVLNVRRRTILFSGVSLHNFFFDRISYDVSILSYKCSLKQYLNSCHSLPNIPYWYIYLTTYLTKLTRFFRGPIYSPWGSLNVWGSLDGYELFYAVLSLHTVHSSLVTVLFMHVLLYFIVWMIQLFALASGVNAHICHTGILIHQLYFLWFSYLFSCTISVYLTLFAIISSIWEILGDFTWVIFWLLTF